MSAKAWRLPVALAAAAACACARSGPEDRLALASAKVPMLGLLFIAEQDGCFRAERLAVEHRAFPSGRDALAAMLSGHADVATCLETPVVLQAPAHPDLRILTSLHASRRDTRLVARADRRIATAADLRGKRIGVPRDTNAEFFLETLLAIGAVPRADVSIVDVAPAAAAGALAAGSVDAVAIWSPYADAAEAAVAGGTVTLLSEVYGEISVLVTRQDVLAARRPALAKLVRCLAGAERLALEHPAAAWARLRGAFPEVSEPSLRDQWARVTPQLGLQNVLVSILRQESEWLRRERRAGGEAPDFAAMLAPDLLRAAEPEAVTYLGGG